VVAIGHPRGFRFTATTGIVSAVHTTQTLPEDIREFLDAPDDQIWIQTNATIAGGSSGGPLLNLAGQVVGVNTWITTDVDFGFAAHVSHLQKLLQQADEELTPIAKVTSASKSPLAGALGETDKRVAALLTDFQRNQEEFLVTLMQARTVSDRQRLILQSPARATAAQLLQLARENPQTTAAYQSLVFALSLSGEIVPPTAARPLMKETTGLLLRDHLQEESLATVAMALLQVELPEGRSFLEQLGQKSPHRVVQGQACLALAISLSRIERLDARQQDQVVALLERVVGEFRDLPLGETTLGLIAEPLLFQQKFLAVGREAPDIVGRDANGQEFKLSDYRGRVVMLDFFADWCPYCSRMYPYERTLVQRHQNRPFALLGINGDTQQRLQLALTQKNVTWRTWWDGRSGPIATRWNVASYPTIYILDHKGIIQYRIDGEPSPRDLDAVIGRLVAIADAEKKGVSPSDINVPQVVPGTGLLAATEWIKTNNSFGPDSFIARDLPQKINGNIAKGFQNVSVIFGPGLVESGKANWLNIWDDQMFVFELTATQARTLKLKDKDVQVTTSRRSSLQAPALSFKLEQPTINDSTRIQGTSNLTGEVTCTGLGTDSDRNVVRVSYRKGESTTSSFHYLEQPPTGSKLTLSFSVAAINPPNQPAHRGPLVVFIDVCSIVQGNGTTSVTSMSNAVAVLVNVK
jgi:peroxiredoxin